jgi:CRP-like cAMP-binding protein
MDPNPLIRKLEGYAPLTDDDKATMRALCDEQVTSVRAKRDIIRDGESPDCIHLILDGWAARYKLMPDGSRHITAFLIPGDFCDLHSTVLATMDHGIVALTDCKVAFLDSGKLDRITSERSLLTKALWWMTLVDEATLREWVSNSRRKAVAALAHLLCEMHIRMRSVDLVNDNRLNLPLTQEDLADATGMTSVHMNRTIQTLREAGLISLRARELVIPDVQALAKAGGFDDRYLHLRKDRPRRGE